MRSKGEVSAETFRQKPCMDTQRRTPTPMEASLPCSVQTPVRPATVKLLTSNGGQVDQELLQETQVAVQVAAAPRQVEDRVADQLAGAVVGDVAAAVHPQRARW